MRMIASGCAGLCLLLAMGVAAAQPPPVGLAVAPPPLEVQKPQWVRKPSSEDLNRSFPQRALRLGKAGRAVMRCKITGAGTLHECELISETPTGFGFGQAALEMAGLFELAGEVGGRSIVVPIIFGLN